jgi:hypothetical protein
MTEEGPHGKFGFDRRLILAAGSADEAVRSLGQGPWMALLATTTHIDARVLHIAFAISRSLNFWILPVDVFGTSVNTMVRGHL